MTTALETMKAQAPADSYIVSAEIDRGNGRTITKSTHAQGKERVRKTLERWEAGGNIISMSVKPSY